LTERKIPIIPVAQDSYNLPEIERRLDLPAICVFAATGFFLDQDTYWQNEKMFKPATDYQMDTNGHVVGESDYFSWYYEPRNITLDQAVDEFTELFEKIVNEQIGSKPAILPLSGGLDSRSQAVALKQLDKDVVSYSYSFEGGFRESGIGREIAEKCGFRFDEMSIPPSYLWKNIDELADMLDGRSEFTHPRQMAVLEEFKKYQGAFSLGHWGDVLFDRGLKPELEHMELTALMKKKVVKKGGMELAERLWAAWDLDGSFQEYLTERLATLAKAIKIKNTSARTRAFKSLYWAPRWTSVNLAVFQAAHPITLPYYDNRMCEFICTVPEEFLADRKIQIEYIKRRNPEVAKIMWQDHRPYNLTDYHLNKSPRNIPYRAINKGKRVLNKMMGKKYIMRNWELQFLGDDNREELKKRLLDKEFVDWIPKEISSDFMQKFFVEDGVRYSHSVSTLLTLSEWHKRNLRG